MNFTCPVCNTKNKHTLDFEIEEYVCISCRNLIDIKSNKSVKVFHTSPSNIVLDTTKKGMIDGVEYFVTGVVMRKYGSSTYWREYYLRDKNGNIAFLSESDGHWVFMLPQTEPLKETRYFCEFKGKQYRWYETTPSTIHIAYGFFEDKLSFKVASYKEFANGTEMVSREEGGIGTEYFWGRHISKSYIKKSFKADYLPYYYGIGIVQPYYFNVKQVVNILGIAALLVCVLQYWVYNSRTNYTVFEEKLEFKNIKDKEYLSKSFELSGGSAPLNVEAFSNVDNSWATFDVSLVNEKNNEVITATKDIEYYHGFEGGENWAEGNKSVDYNFCGVAPGKYHFLISGEKEEPVTEAIPSIKDITVTHLPEGGVLGRDTVSHEVTYYENKNEYHADSADIARHEQVINKIKEAEAQIEPKELPSLKIIAKWYPVSFWNFWIIMIPLAIIGVVLYYGKNYFDRAKWNNSSNSPF